MLGQLTVSEEDIIEPIARTVMVIEREHLAATCHGLSVRRYNSRVRVRVRLRLRDRGARVNVRVRVRRLVGLWSQDDHDDNNPK